MSSYWIQTFTGIRFDLLEPTIEMINITDIAHHLSIENRFAGATKFPYSVGYHSILMSEICEQQNWKLDYLLHDAAEAYTKDIPTPIKRRFFGNAYDKPFEVVQKLIENKFKVGLFPELILADKRMAVTERNQLLTTPPDKWHPSLENLELFKNISISELHWKNVEALFLKEYEKLRRV